MIEVSGLSKRFGEVQALDNVEFTVEKGQIVGFLGANGAGKTTTMDIICGCTGPDHGTVRVSGYDIVDQPLEAKVRLGYLPDEPPIYPDMRVVDYMRYAAKLNKVPAAEIDKRIAEVSQKLSIQDVAGRLVGNLSKGYRQRVALAQAIIHNPDVLVLDEPTEGLDPNQIVQIRELIRSLGGDHTIILSSHILSEVQNTCDHIVIIHKGKIVQQGTYDELIASRTAGTTYQVRVGQNAAKLVEELPRAGAVATAKLLEPENQLIEVTLTKGQDDVDPIAKTILDGGYGLREIAAHRQSLEDVFFQLTN